MRLYYGGYGHHPSGKQYVYWGNDNLRTGQNVVAPVTNWRTGKTYNTMFTIMRTSKAGTNMAENEAQRLSQSGIGIKSIQGTDVLSNLKGGENYESKKEWKETSNNKYLARLSERLGNSETNTLKATARLLGG